MMEDTEEDLKSRKRRRRSIRNLRRQSGIVPFCLNEEPPTVEQPELNGNEVTSTEDPYGSLWMETEPPVKTKKRRQSGLLVGLSRHSGVLKENALDVDLADEVSKAAENDSMLGQDLKKPKRATDVCDPAADLDKNSVGRTHYINSYEENKNHTEKWDFQKNITNDKGSLTISYDKIDSERGASLSLVPPQIDTELQKKGQNSAECKTNSECTPPDELIVTTPQSMSPDFPVSPSDLIYLGNHDNSYISYLPADRNIDIINQNDLLEQEHGDKHDKSDAMLDVNSEINKISKAGEMSTWIVLADTEEISDVETSENSLRLETSASCKENNELSLSDKENTVVENKNLELEDNNNSSNSPGFLSLCKALAGKVVDLVKTSPSYLTNILQDKKSDNTVSPSVKQQDLKNMELSPEPLDSSCSAVKLAMTLELDSSLEKIIESSNQVVQVYSVTGIAKADECEKLENDNIDQMNNIERKETESVPHDFSDTMVQGKKQKRRKSVSKVFFDTFNAVSSELNKTVHCDGTEICGETADMESVNKNSRVKSDFQNILSQSVGLDEEDGLSLSENNDKKVQTIRDNQAATETANDKSVMKNDRKTVKKNSRTDISASFSSATFSEPCTISSNNQKSSKHRKRRSVDVVLLSDEFGGDKLNENNNSIVTERKRRKSYSLETSEISLTEIRDHKNSVKSTYSEQQVEQEPCPSSNTEVSVSCTDVATVNRTDSTTCVVEDFSKLELQVTIPQPVQSQKDEVNKKKDRRRRRSNNFYFSSVCNDAEEPLSDKKNKVDSIKQPEDVDKNSIETNMTNSADLNSKAQDCQINAVTEEISQVSINDNDSVKILQTDSDNMDQETCHKTTQMNSNAAKEKQFNSGASAIRRDKENLTAENGPEVDVIDSHVKGKEAAVSIETFLPTENESAPRRNRRRSADVAALKIQMCASDVDIYPVDEENAGPTPVRHNRKRKKSPEIPLEDIYRNKNYKKPQEKTWETIFESPKVEDQLFSKRRIHTILDFEKPTQAKLKRRSQRAVKNGWDPKKRKRKALSDDLFQMKLSDVFSDLDQLEEDSISDRIKKTIEY